VCSRDERDALMYSSDAQEAFRPDSCRSEVHSLTSAPKLESETRQSNLSDPIVKNCTEQISCWQNGDRLASKETAFRS